MIGKTRLFHRRRMLHETVCMINASIMALLMASTLYSVAVSRSWLLAMAQIAALAILLLSEVLFHTTILNNKETVDGKIYGKARIIYVLRTTGTLPVCLLAYTQGNLAVLSEYGFSAMVILASFSNLVIPMSIMIFVSLCFWFEVVFIFDENGLYVKCNELKKTIRK